MCVIGNNYHASYLTARHGDLAWDTRGLEGFNEDQVRDKVKRKGVAFLCLTARGYLCNQRCDTAFIVLAGYWVSVNQF